METEKIQSPGMYYTNDHEWIEFKDEAAYVGVSSFKLTGFRGIHQIIFNRPSGFKKRGESIAIIKYNEYTIDVHMPVDGNILQVNPDLVYGDQNFLLDHAENSDWIAFIVPSQPNDRLDLLTAEQYLQTIKTKNSGKSGM
jgi:glycine cleavage system H protein